MKCWTVRINWMQTVDSATSHRRKALGYHNAVLQVYRMLHAILEPTTSTRGSKGQHPGCALPRNGLLRRRHRSAARQGQAVPGDTHLRWAGQLVVQACDGERVRGRVIARRAKGDLRAGATRCRAVQRAAAHSRKGLQLLRGCVRSTRLVLYTACSSVKCRAGGSGRHW